MVGGDERHEPDAVSVQRPGEMEGVVALEPGRLREAGQLVGPGRQVEIAGDDERAGSVTHEIGQDRNVLGLERGMERPGEMHAGKLERRAVHLDLRPAQHERTPRRVAPTVDTAVLDELVFGQDHEPKVAEAIGIA